MFYYFGRQLHLFRDRIPVGHPCFVEKGISVQARNRNSLNREIPKVLYNKIEQNQNYSRAHTLRSVETVYLLLPKAYIASKIVNSLWA
jgi:hypothetical protein